jgi:hypothetical protein
MTGFPESGPIALDARDAIQALLERCQPQTSELLFVNRDQDLGLPGLRQFERCYQPDHLAPRTA